MKQPLELQEMRYQAGRMETTLLVVAALAAILGVFALATRDWTHGVGILLLATLLFATGKGFGFAAAIIHALTREVRPQTIPTQPNPDRTQP